MYFRPYVVEQATGKRIDVIIDPASKQDLQFTSEDPLWQSNWNSEYLSDSSTDIFAVKTGDGELIGLGAYQIRGKATYVFIVYIESAPHSNPTMKKKFDRKYIGIGQLLIAFGIKYSVDNGCRGDVVFDAKTDNLAVHYEKDFNARRVSGGDDGIKRFMLADEDAWRVFSKYLEVQNGKEQ